ncbi:hypothetical protein GCK72_001837 [Caenorhabditis remanei]|uniref:Oxidative stress-responsive serine-rich protein 1 n=2 Tax=Caenorhabditis remanei TaxID=31234 RepID=E3LMX2_CAERE|nr:hypothetical protein GCK72_001837 [Caenorhabditis remanei]EFP02743.1 hypothetical protein CRE_28213 [Caenorhabditis remanei]KAF1770020.1 hypothetical protein GCK72_001837 [Caenorhabditis remanei]
MTEGEPPPRTSTSSSPIPSTSTCPITVTCDSESDDSTCPSSISSQISSFLTLDFDKLSLDSDLCEGRYDQNRRTPGPQSPTWITHNMPPIAENAQFYRSTSQKYGRFSPYEVPIKLRRRRKTQNISKTKPTDIEILLKIKLKGDVEPLRMCIFDKEQILPKPCSVQAARPPSPVTETEEVDELSEYFTHFVRVELKMSSLAESMYV